MLPFTKTHAQPNMDLRSAFGKRAIARSKASTNFLGDFLHSPPTAVTSQTAKGRSRPPEDRR